MYFTLHWNPKPKVPYGFKTKSIFGHTTCMYIDFLIKWVQESKGKP